MATVSVEEVGRPQKLRSVQVLRGVAACAVVVLHSQPTADINRFGVGAAGVDLFFVISGFIIATIGQGREPLRFLRDRAWRIYPLWWLAALPWLIAAPQSLVSFFTTLTLWPVYGDVHYYPALSVGWTLAFEMMFYLAFALALRTRAWLPFAVYVLCAALAVLSNKAIFNFLGSPLVIEFLMGIAIAKLPKIRRLAVPLLSLAVLGFAAAPISLADPATALETHWAFVRVAWWGVPAALLLYSALCLETLFVSSHWNIPVLLGDASYSIYLFHRLAVQPIHLPVIVELVIGTGFGVAMHFLVERKITAWRSARQRMGAIAGLNPSAEQAVAPSQTLSGVFPKPEGRDTAVL